MEQLISAVAELALPALVSGLLWLITKGVSYVVAKTSNEYIKGALVRLQDAVSTAVHEVENTVKKEFALANADGKLTKKEAEHIKAVAIAAAKTYLGPKGIAQIIKVIGVDEALVDKFIGGKIEQSLVAMKTGGQAGPK